MAPALLILAAESTDTGVNPLGDDLLVWLTLAMGGALAAGNILALLRPRGDEPDDERDGELDRAPLARSLAMTAIGLVAAVWALVSLIV